MTQEISVSEYKSIDTIYEKLQYNKKFKKLFSDKYSNFSQDNFISRSEYRVLKKIGKYFNYVENQNIDKQLKTKNEALKKSYMRDIKDKM